MANRQDIDPAVAKMMVQSYQASVSNTAIWVATTDADELRAYLADAGIKHVAFFLAHNEDWATTHFGQQDDSQLTIVIVATDANGLAAKTAAGGFMDYQMLCPPRCDKYDTPTFWD